MSEIKGFPVQVKPTIEIKIEALIAKNFELQKQVKELLAEIQKLMSVNEEVES